MKNDRNKSVKSTHMNRPVELFPGFDFSDEE